ncbi:MAG: PqqD family protein [Acetatifactor sp.]|nr:PqqD family protein [Acetatifactor sp.]
MDYSVYINERMVAVKDISRGKIRLKYMTSVPVNFNEVGLLVLNLCNEGKSVNETVDIILERCDMPESEREGVTGDVLNLLRTLWKSGIIKWKDGIFPDMDAYSESFDGYTIREYTIEDSEGLVAILDTFGFDAFVKYKENQCELIEAAMLLMNVRFYEYRSNSCRLVIQASYDSKVNQVNLQGISFADGGPDCEAFDRLIEWEIRRDIRNNMYVKNHFKEMPVYIHAADPKLLTMLNGLGFEKIGTLQKEVRMSDVDFCIKYVQLR